MSVRKWLYITLAFGFISLPFSILFFITDNTIFTVIAWIFTLCELFSVVQLVRYSRKEENASDNI